MTIEVEKLKQYLLGNLPEEENEEIDLSIISDDSLTENLLIAENEIIEDFIEHNLSQKEAELFRKNFLTTPKRKEKVLHTAKLKTYAKNSVGKTQKGVIVPSWSIKNITTRKFLRYLIPVFAVVIICLIVVIWVTSFKTSIPLTPLEAEYNQLNKDIFDNLENYKTLARLNLKTNINRSSRKKISFMEFNLTDKVLFNLELPAGTNPKAFYKIELIKEQGTAFTLDELQVHKNPDGAELLFLLPKEVLKKGNYTIKATGNSDDSQIIYSFLIE